ncbi:MAG: hypothetical protein ACYTG1_10050 [Planctomycetota bacterium]|jgi:hypothetical protein
MRVVPASLVAISLVAPAAAAAPPLDRDRDPVVLDGGALPTLLGTSPGAVVAFRHDGAWTQIPVQVDERTEVDYGVVYDMEPVALTTLAYADASTYTGADVDPDFDADDELVFMARDAGPRAPAGAGAPAGVLPGSGVELAITDPLDGGVAWAYLFVSAGGPAPDAGQDYVSYAFVLLAGSYIPNYGTSVGPNPEDSVVLSPHYRVHFADRWIRDELAVTAGGAGGADLLDRHKNLFAPGVCSRSEDTFSAGEGAFFVNKDGPVRCLRSYMGANSGPITQRRHVFYDRREDCTTFLRVHAIASVVDMFDYSDAELGMRYHNDLNPAGVDVDGVPDAVVPGNISWEMVTGPEGSLLFSHRLDTDTGLVPTSFYSDDATPPETQCTGDAFAYGTSGPFTNQAIPNTDPLLGAASTFVTRRTIYYEPPGATVADAAARHAEAQADLAAAAAPYDETLVPGDADGDGVVDVRDLLDVLAAWGPCPPFPAPCPADVDRDGAVDVSDLLAVLAHWSV